MNGAGVLIRLEGVEANDFVSKYEKKYKADVYTIQKANGAKVRDHFDDLFYSSETTPKKGKYKGDPRTRVIDEYSLTNDNCTTLSICGVESGVEGGKLTYKEKINHPKFKGTINKHLNSISPDGLNDQLQVASTNGEQNGIIKDEE